MVILKRHLSSAYMYLEIHFTCKNEGFSKPFYTFYT